MVRLYQVEWTFPPHTHTQKGVCLPSVVFKQYSMYILNITARLCFKPEAALDRNILLFSHYCNTTSKKLKSYYCYIQRESGTIVASLSLVFMCKERSEGERPSSVIGCLHNFKSRPRNKDAEREPWPTSIVLLSWLQGYCNHIKEKAHRRLENFAFHLSALIHVTNILFQISQNLKR